MNEEIQTIDQPETGTLLNNLNAVDPDMIKKAARIIRAVNHPLRQMMLTLLKENQIMNVTDLYVKLRIEQSVASQHLKILRNSNAVKTRREGKQIFYSINGEQIQHIMECAVTLVNK